MGFVEWYSAMGISPVSQDIEDLDRHFERREGLCRSLGLVPAWIGGRRLLEFGPGSGFNSLYFVSLEPAGYDLVEGNPVGYAETTQRLEGAKNVVVHHSRFESFETRPVYDLVWAEGCLPHNSNPKALLSHVATFTKPGGVLVVSLVSGVSWLSEIFRRLV